MTVRAIFPADLAKSLKPHTGQKYQPSNGTEGEMFFRSWCFHCQRDKAMREGCDVDECDDNERCEIIGNTMAFAIDDPMYPVEWQIGQDGQPCCTAFVPVGETVPPPRCKNTIDMFEGSSE